MKMSFNKMSSINFNSGPVVSFLFLVATLVLSIVICFQIYNQNKDNTDPKIQEIVNRFRMAGIFLAVAIGLVVLAILVIIATMGISFLTEFGSLAIGSLIGVSIIATILILISFALYVTAFVYLWLGYVESLQTPIAPYALMAAVSFTVFLGFSAFSFMSNNAYLNFNKDTSVPSSPRPVPLVASRLATSPAPVSSIMNNRPESQMMDITNLKPKNL